jgi:hypothetical protein
VLDSRGALDDETSETEPVSALVLTLQLRAANHQIVQAARSSALTEIKYGAVQLYTVRLLALITSQRLPPAQL